MKMVLDFDLKSLSSSSQIRDCVLQAFKTLTGWKLYFSTLIILIELMYLCSLTYLHKFHYLYDFLDYFIWNMIKFKPLINRYNMLFK